MNPEGGNYTRKPFAFSWEKTSVEGFRWFAGRAPKTKDARRGWKVISVSGHAVSSYKTAQKSVFEMTLFVFCCTYGGEGKSLASVQTTSVNISEWGIWRLVPLNVLSNSANRRWRTIVGVCFNCRMFIAVRSTQSPDPVHSEVPIFIFGGPSTLHESVIKPIPRGFDSRT